MAHSYLTRECADEVVAVAKKSDVPYDSIERTVRVAAFHLGSFGGLLITIDFVCWIPKACNSSTKAIKDCQRNLLWSEQ